MKNIIKLKAMRSIAIIAIVAVIGFAVSATFTACGNDKNGNGDGVRDAKTYTGTAASGVTYTLKIEDGGSREVLTPTKGDKYTLTQTANTKKSTGTVTKVVGGELTLAPKEDPDDEFTATVSGDNITAMSGNITWDDGTANEAPVTLTPSGGIDPNPGPGGPITPPEMVFVPGGSFQMGNPDQKTFYTNELPAHTVTLTGFYMGKYEVTQAQYEAVMGSKPSGIISSYGIGDNYPVYNVSWYDALVFCNRLSVAGGLTPAYRISGSTDPSSWGSVPTSSNGVSTATWDAVEVVSGSTGYRLPTEAQWEYAAKGGNGSPGNYTYAGSNTVDDVAWNWDNIPGLGYSSQPVGTKTPNGLGLYDMTGNVREWCWDWLGAYSSEAQTDPVGASSGSVRVRRGGSRGHHATEDYLRSTYRDNMYPRSGDFLTGFRVLRPAQ